MVYMCLLCNNTHVIHNELLSVALLWDTSLCLGVGALCIGPTRFGPVLNPTSPAVGASCRLLFWFKMTTIKSLTYSLLPSSPPKSTVNHIAQTKNLNLEYKTPPYIIYDEPLFLDSTPLGSPSCGQALKTHLILRWKYKPVMDLWLDFLCGIASSTERRWLISCSTW
jgi:hypothetical protein